MKSTLKFFILCLLFVAGLLLQAYALANEAAPQITVKKKSNLVPDAQIVGLMYCVSSAVNTANGDNLVVWMDDPGRPGGFLVNGRIVNAKGKVTSKKLATISQDDFQMGDSVAYNPGKNEYLVVYPTLGSIYGQKLDVKAKHVGNEFEIIPATTDKRNLYPHLIFNPKTNGYALIWERTDGILAILLDQSGKATGSELLLFRNPGSNGFYDDDTRGLGEGRIFDAVFLPSGKLLVAFQQRFSDSAGDYYLATIDADLGSFSLVKINKNTVNYTDVFHVGRYGYLASLAVLPDGSALIFYADHKKVTRRIIDSNGKLGKSSPAFSGPLKKAALWDPAVAFATTADGKTVGLLIASQDDPDADFVKAIWGQVLNDKGKPQGEPVLLETLDLFVYSSGSKLIPLKQPAFSSALPFVFIQDQAARIIDGPCCGYSPSLTKFDLEVQP